MFILPFLEITASIGTASPSAGIPAKVVTPQELPYIEMPFTSHYGLYPSVDFELGTPGQKILTFLDTGSWFSYIPADVAGYPRNPNDPTNVFNASASSTFQETSILPDGYWHDVSNSDYRWFANDESTWGGQTFNFSFVALTSSQSAIVGLDIRGVEDRTYASVMLRMQDAGKINHLTLALSYNLPNSFRPDTTDYGGNLTFGAIDYSKFTGKLCEVPINTGRVTVDSVTYYEENPSSVDFEVQKALSLPNDTTTMFDTGGIDVVLPQQTYDQIFSHISRNGEVDMDYVNVHRPVVCYNIGENYSFKVKLAERNGLTNIIPHDTNDAAQGPALFKQAYTVWDYENKRMLFAQPNPNPGPLDIRAIDESYVVRSSGPKQGI